MTEYRQRVTLSPSTAARPDLDWSQVQETLLVLNMAVAQIEVAMRDSGGSVDVLTQSFTSMHDNLMTLVAAAESLPDSPAKQAIQAAGQAASGQTRQAIVAFQFYDRLSQRLTHACRSLDDLSAIISDPARLYNPAAWHGLQQMIRSRYTMEDEKRMFDALLQTGSVQAALEQFTHNGHPQSGDASDVELF